MSKDINTTTSNSKEDKLIDEYFQRRDLRYKQRQIFEQIQNSRDKLIEFDLNDNDNLLQQFRQQSNKINSKVNHIRELQLDSINTRELASIINQQSTKLENYTSKFDIITFINGLKHLYIQDMNTNELNWILLGNDVNKLFKNIYGMNTFIGPIHREVKVRKVSERRPKDIVSLNIL